MNTQLEKDLYCLLEQEREAARSADVGQLLSLQDQKSTLMAQLLDGEGEPQLDPATTQLATSNVKLIRHLCSCLRGLTAGGDPDVYSASGEARSMRPSYVKGAL